MLSKNEVNENARGGSEIQAEYLNKYVDNELLNNFQIVVSRIRELEDDKIKLFWTKETAKDPESQRLRDQYILDKFLFIIHNSDYQRAQFHELLQVPFSKQHVLKNAIEPSSVKISQKRVKLDKIKLIYSSTPQRGLNILYSVFNELYKEDSNVELDVFSSFDIYGHQTRNAPFEPLFQLCRDHPGINYHGSVSHEELLEETKKSHILAFPSTWEESSCTTVLENASAGNLIITNNLGALPETTAGFALMYDFHLETNVHANRFFNALKYGISVVRNNIEIDGLSLENHLEKQKEYIDRFYNWELRGREWSTFLRNILGN